MLLRLYLPIIVFILIKNLTLLETGADAIVNGFREDYQRIVCARSDVYRRNLEDGFQFLLTRFAYLADQAHDVEDYMPESEPCTRHDFAVYREINTKLPEVYPNWLYKEILNDAGQEIANGDRNER